MNTDFFLSAMTTYGPLALGLGLFLGPLGLPIPTALLVLAAGAFTRQGVMDWSTAWGLSLVVTVLGDTASYALGRFAGGWVQRLVGKRRAAGWQRAQERFRQQGGLAIYVTRFLLTALDVPTNLIAGSSHYAFRRFLAWDVAGRVTWILFYGGLGYIFSGQWQAVSRIVSIYGVWLGAAVAVGIGIYYLFRLLRQNNRARV
jgi:membrane protein DedA with SNARE-associated domain